METGGIGADVSSLHVSKMSPESPCSREAVKAYKEEGSKKLFVESNQVLKLQSEEPAKKEETECGSKQVTSDLPPAPAKSPQKAPEVVTKKE